MRLDEVAIVALAAWRLALFLVDDRGPADIMVKARKWLHTGPVYDDPTLQSSWERLWLCVWCMSLWTAVYSVAAYQLGGDVGQGAVELLAVWGAATALDMLARHE